MVEHRGLLAQNLSFRRENLVHFLEVLDLEMMQFCLVTKLRWGFEADCGMDCYLVEYWIREDWFQELEQQFLELLHFLFVRECYFLGLDCYCSRVLEHFLFVRGHCLLALEY